MNVCSWNVWTIAIGNGRILFTSWVRFLFWLFEWPFNNMPFFFRWQFSDLFHISFHLSTFETLHIWQMTAWMNITAIRWQTVSLIRLNDLIQNEVHHSFQPRIVEQKRERNKKRRTHVVMYQMYIAHSLMSWNEMKCIWIEWCMCWWWWTSLNRFSGSDIWIGGVWLWKPRLMQKQQIID